MTKEYCKKELEGIMNLVLFEQRKAKGNKYKLLRRIFYDGFLANLIMQTFSG